MDIFFWRKKRAENSNFQTLVKFLSLSDVLEIKLIGYERALVWEISQTLSNSPNN